MLRSVFKVVLIAVLALLVLLLLLGLVLWAGWPWWVGLFILLGLVGIGLAALLARKFLARKREQKFIQQVVAKDEAVYRQMASKEQDAARQLRDRWMEAIETLRKSHLRKAGNPLYVLPWYMVIGESGAGKTTAIQSARLSSSFSEVNRTSGISGTRNCDWWFFEQAVILDTAGRYALRVDENRDQQEWQDFLTLLAKYRKKEPLNGLVVMVAADRLSHKSPEALQEEGRTIRKRIEEVTRMLGARSPIYLMVTKCDLVQGATQFCSLLPEASLNQAMGYLNQQLSADGVGVIEKALRTVGDRLRDLRLLLLQRTKDRGAAAGMLLFPEELEKLQQGLNAFGKGAFQENPYQETPLLRGVFFSSGRQEGTPFSHFLNALGLIQARDVLPGTSKGLFLHDFFARILPADRRLFKPTQHIMQWRRLTRNLGLTAWIALLLAACGVLSYAFIKNLNAMADARREFQTRMVLQGDVKNDIATLERFRQAVLKIEANNRGWWIPRLGLNGSLRVEQELRQKYADLFHSGFLQRFDLAFGDRIKGFGPQTPKAAYGYYVGHLLRRITLLKSRLDQQNLAKLSGLPAPEYAQLLLGGEVNPELQKVLGRAYIHALAWDQDERRLNSEMASQQARLQQLLTTPGVTLNWLVEWVGADPSLADVSLSDFWGGAADSGQPRIAGAYTREGKARIEAAIAQIESALSDPAMLGEAKKEFEQWYTQNYFSQWKNFLQAFQKGPALLKGKPEWQATVKTLPTDKGPYYGLIQRIAQDFQSFDPDAAVPTWAGQAYRFQEVREAARGSDALDPQKAGLISKAASKVSSTIKNAERALGVKIRVALTPEAKAEAAKALAAYQGALAAAVKAADSRKSAFEMAAALYQQDPATGDAPLLAAHRALDSLQAVMAERQDEGEALFFSLLEGNLRFIQSYLGREAACSLQTLWKDGVLTELQDARGDADIAQIMMGSDGLASKFIKGPAAPFVGRSLNKGFYAREIFGQALPLELNFFGYLGKSAQAARPGRTNFSVAVRALPTDCNPEAAVQPHMTVLELQCNGVFTRLENLNYPVAKNFAWSSGSCGDVALQIGVGNLLLTRRYTGNNAFARFLNDFKNGQHTFNSSDFPAEEAALKQMGIRYIRPKYQFQGQSEILAQLANDPGAPPSKIATCWD